MRRKWADGLELGSNDERLAVVLGAGCYRETSPLGKPPANDARGADAVRDILGQFGDILGQFGDILGRFGGIFGQFGGILGQFGGNFGTF